jgi:phage FluMu protein Com
MEEGECAFCLQGMEDPIQIPCGHTFCQSCLDDYALSETNDAKCPKCRTVFNEFENYSINFTLKSLIECLKE